MTCYAARRATPQSASSFVFLGTAFLLLSNWCFGAGASSTGSRSSTTSSPLYYESVRSLDEYGNAVQIQHAQAAADQRGRLVLALHHREHVWIVSPLPSLSTAHHLRQPQPPAWLLQPITTPPLRTVGEEPTTAAAATVYLCCTGVQADAHALLQHVRRYAATVAERYNHHAPHSMAYAVAQFHRQFWGYNLENSWTTTTATNLQQQQSLSNWGRPLGLRSLVVTCRPDTNRVQVQLVEPSGLVRDEREPQHVWILGSQSELLWQALARQSPPPPMGNDDDVAPEDTITLKRVLWQAFRKVILVDNDTKQEDAAAAAASVELLLEIVSPTGDIRREILTQDLLSNDATSDLGLT